jgi:cyclohexanone monooxygenase
MDDQSAPIGDIHAVDIDAVRERYRRERDKRLRAEGDSQYTEAAGAFAQFCETDPYTPVVEREPILDDADVVVLGGGFAGLLAAARIKEAGIDDIRILEMGGDFGGTWYWNRYPGIQCDIESYCYMPLLEEVGYMPKDRYAYGPEIYEHCRRIARHFDLYGKAVFGTIIRSLRWDPAINRWRVSTNRGDDIRARFVVMAQGFNNRPKLPGVPGLDAFKGHSFHTSRWDYDYTGGEADGELTKLADKRVAVIGTGASAIQVVPFLGKHAKQLYVFQRTPSSVDERGNRKTDPEWVKTLQPGWQADRQKNFHVATFEQLYPGMPDLVDDGWTEINRVLQAMFAEMGHPELSMDEYMAIRERVDYGVMERVRQRVESTVEDPETAEKLKPYYRFLCKRPCFNDDFLPTFNRPNVTLVDVSETRGVERLTETGVVANGVEYPVDCIVYASGFEVTTELGRRIGVDSIEGREGRSLFDHWAGGFQTLHGLMTHGFPNLFFTGFTQGGASVNVGVMFDHQARHMGYVMKTALDRQAETVEPTPEAQEAWGQAMRETAVSNEAFLRQCTPGYYNTEGGEVIRSHLGEIYGPGFYAFVDLIAAWRETERLEGLALGTADAGAGG